MMTPKKTTAVNKPLIWARSLPLERYRLPSDGRKWRMVARNRQGVYNYLAGFPFGDGTFSRGGINYSPQEAAMLKHFGFSRSWLEILLNGLKELGLLSWTRLNRHSKREYTLQNPDVNYSPNTDVVCSSEKPIGTESIQIGTESVRGSDGVCSKPPFSPNYSNQMSSGKTAPSPTKEPTEEPTNQPSVRTAEENSGGMAGGLGSGGESSHAVELTEDAVLDKLEVVHRGFWDKTDEYEGWGIPYALPLSGKDALLKSLRVHLSGYKTDVPTFLQDVQEGFYLWWCDRYLTSFTVAFEAQERDKETGTTSKVPRPIHTPLAVFAKEFPRYMGKAREQRELEADEGEKS